MRPTSHFALDIWFCFQSGLQECTFSLPLSVLDMAERSLKPYHEEPRSWPHFMCSMRGVVGLPPTSTPLSRRAWTAQTFSSLSSLSITSSLSGPYPPAYGVFFLPLSPWPEWPTCGRFCCHLGARNLRSFPLLNWSFWPKEFEGQVGQIMQPWSKTLGLVWFKC